MRRLMLVAGVVLITALARFLPLSATTEAAPVPKPSADARARDAVKALTDVLPLPDEPVYTGTDDEWAAAAKRMGVVFPAEYKRFIQVYGRVAVSQFMIFHTPLAESEQSGLLEQVEFFVKHSEKGDPPVWPEQGGVLPIASTVCADTIAYRCKGKPDEWTIVVMDKGRTCEEHPFGLVEFMSRLAVGKLESKILMQTKDLRPPLVLR
jgi:SMI1-KNR4 cell-wall